MANGRPTFSVVTCPNFCPPRRLKRKVTSGSPLLLVEALLRVDQILSVNHDALLGTTDRPAALLHGQRLDLVRRVAGVGDELEVELGGLSR